jgi:predicted GIY-YIG superfamily endonuclease
VTADLNPTTPSASTSASGSAMRRHPLGTVYLFHFDQRYEHAGHYTGWAEDLDHRVAEHQAGRGARLIEVITQAGIGFRLARTWPGVTRARERQLKRQGGASRHCPICQDERRARGRPRRPTRDQPGQGDRRAGPDQQRPTHWASAVPTRGTRPDRVRAFLELNPGFARPARASQAKQWGGARSREEVELLGPRVTSAAWDENAQPSQHRVATVTRRAVQARLQARQQRSAQWAEQSRAHELAARTHQRLLARQARQRQAADGRPNRTRPDHQLKDRDRER